MPHLLPSQTIKTDYAFNLINGACWTLSEQDKDWRMIVVYRGLHCPVCQEQLKALAPLLDDFAAAGIAVIAASMDTKARAEKAFEEWGLGSLPIAYGMEEDFAHDFGLYLSDSIKEDEPKRFTEPAILLFKGDTFHAIWLQSLPFARPPFDEILDGIKFIDKDGYPARGTVR